MVEVSGGGPATRYLEHHARASYSRSALFDTTVTTAAGIPVYGAAQLAEL